MSELSGRRKLLDAIAALRAEAGTLALLSDASPATCKTFSMVLLLPSISTEQTPPLVQLPVTNGVEVGRSSAIGCNNNSTNPATINWFETGVWIADKTANNAAMNSNQHGYWNF